MTTPILDGPPRPPLPPYLSVVTVAIPYLCSACAQLVYLVSRRRKVNGWALVARNIAIAGTSILFSLWVAFTAGYQSMLLLIGIPIYAFLKGRRERRSDVAAPLELTDDGTISPAPVLQSS
jgi:APA family basic amino acid/polyamine antiporter